MMEKIIRCLDWKDWLALGVIALLSLLYFNGLLSVPFHPDEATQIYMSKDASLYIQGPLSLSWEGNLPLTAEERYRAIDAPLSRYLIGTARGLTSTPALVSDWDWSGSWSENEAAGALPSQRQLLIARCACTVTLLAGLLFYYPAVKKTLPGLLAIFSLILLGLHPLILLHGRRAMSEAALVFGVAFFLWAALQDKRSPWLIGLALGLALNAKHTAIGLLPAGLLAVSLLPKEEASPKRIAGRITRFLLAAGLIVAILNPFYWKTPYQALQTGLQTRITLSARQRADHGQILGLEEVNLPVRAAAMLSHTFLSPPQTEEVGNYLADTLQSEQEYLENPLHSWNQVWIIGTVLLILSLVGFTFSLRGGKGLSGQRSPNTLIWILSSGGTFLAVLLPLPWQRYIIPMLPVVAYWAAAGLLPLYIKLGPDNLTR